MKARTILLATAAVLVLAVVALDRFLRFVDEVPTEANP